MVRRTCRDSTCPCPNHRPPVGYRFLSAEAVPPLGAGPLVGFVFRVETSDGQRRAYVQSSVDGYRSQRPLPANPLPGWASAVERAERFVARKAVPA